MDRLEGTWTYQKDPTGQVPFEPIMDGGQRVFGADGSVSMTLARSTLVMKGTARARPNTEPLVLDVDWGAGQTNVYTITFRDADSLVLREGKEPGGRLSYLTRTR